MNSQSLVLPTDYAQVPVSAFLWTGIRAFYVHLISENPVLWSYFRGRRNPQADLEGPYYLSGAPTRELVPGKASMASLNDLKGR